jgi:CBS domain-containing protein
VRLADKLAIDPDPDMVDSRAEVPSAQKLARNRISGAPVVEDRKVVGTVSESDLIHAVMPPSPVDRGASILELLTVIGRARPRSRQNKTSVAEVMSSMVIQSVWSRPVPRKRGRACKRCMKTVT